MLRRYCRRLAGDDADDVAQDALLAAWRALGQWRGDGSFAGWLRQIATRRFLDRCRRGGGARFTALEAADALTGNDDIDRRLAVDRALGALPPRERAAALLVFGEGHTHVEAAAAMALPLGTLKSILARARAALIPLLEGEAP